ncbi:hypothetical protein [Robbsia sp. KACC 23696]|uniref:hypothetical protein n=1 Tax=Robbsia sp. KACC 23696 TaxID=3149231 RepID=UPI00325A9B8B
MEFVMMRGDERATFDHHILPRLMWRDENSPLFYKAAFGYALLLSIGARGTGSNARPSLARFFDKTHFDGHLISSDLSVFKNLRDEFYAKFNIAKTYRKFEMDDEQEIVVNDKKYKRLNFENIYESQTSVTNAVAYFVNQVIEEFYKAESASDDSLKLPVFLLSKFFYDIIFNDGSPLNEDNNKNYPKQFETRTRCEWRLSEFYNWMSQAHDKLAEIQEFEFSKFAFYLQNNQTGMKVELTPFFPFANGLSFDSSLQKYDVSLAPEVKTPRRSALLLNDKDIVTYQAEKTDNPSEGQIFSVIYNKFIEIISNSSFLDANVASALRVHLDSERSASANKEKIIASPKSIFPALQAIVDVEQSTEISNRRITQKAIRRLRLASYLPCLLQGKIPEDLTASANDDVADARVDEIRVFHLFANQSANMPLHLIENFKSFTPQYAAHVAEGRAERVEKEEYIWSGPIWIGLAAGLLLSRHLGNWMGELEEPAPSSILVEGNIYFLTTLIPRLHNEQCYYYKMAKQLVLDRSTMQLRPEDPSKHIRSRLTYPSTSPEIVKNAYLTTTHYPFPRVKKTNKGDINDSIPSEYGIQWKYIPVGTIKTRLSPQQIMRASFRKTAQEISNAEVDAITFKNASDLTRLEIERQSRDRDERFLFHRYYWVNDQFNAYYAQRETYAKEYEQLDTDQEWCHLLGHGDGGEDASYNLVAASKHCNTQQLAIETAIRRFEDIHKHLHVHASAYLMGNAGEFLSATQAQNRVAELKKKMPRLAELAKRQLDVSPVIIKSFKMLIQFVLRFEINNHTHFSEFNINAKSNSASENSIIFRNIFTGAFEFLLSNDQKIEGLILSKIFVCIVDLLGGKRTLPISDIESEDSAPAEIFFHKIKSNPDLQKKIRNQLHALLDNYLTIVTWAPPAALFIRYAVKSTASGSSGKLFDMILDAQIENFDRNEFRLLSTAVKYLVFSNHQSSISGEEKNNYFNKLSDAILENIDLFETPSNSDFSIKMLMDAFKKLWDDGFYLISDVTFTFNPFDFSITLLDAVPFKLYGGKLDALVDEDANSYFENKIKNLKNTKNHICDTFLAGDVANQPSIYRINQIINDFDKFLEIIDEGKRQDRVLSWNEQKDRNHMKNVEIALFNCYIEFVDAYWFAADNTSSTMMQTELDGAS